MTITQAQEVINYSEFWALAGCEQRWVYGYQRGEEEAGARRGLHLGTLLHLGGDLWNKGAYADGVWLPPTWTDDINTGGKPGEVQTLSLADFEEELVGRAYWLLERYVQHWGFVPPSTWRVIESERWLMTALANHLLVGRTDGIVQIEGESEEHDGLWLLERKSYGSKGRMDYVHVDPQLVVYKKLVEAEYGREIKGVIYDGIYTYQWLPEKPTQGVLIAEAEMRGEYFASKKAATEWARQTQAQHPGVERPPAESFDRRYVDISAAQVERGEAFLAAAILRRRELREDPFLALPNVGSGCRACGFRARCWDELRGQDPEPDFEIEEGDDLEDPV